MLSSPHRYFIINKPANMVSQFVSTDDVRLLGDLDFSFPEGTHAVGRLDSDSEGLLILTTNKKVTRLLFLSTVPHKRTYLVQVMNKVSETTLQTLRNGVAIPIKDGVQYITPPCDAGIITHPWLITEQAAALPDYIPVTWLMLTLTEGKFRQVRKMMKAIHHKCKRLIRVSIEDLTLGDMKPGEVKEMNEADFFKLLHIEYEG